MARTKAELQFDTFADFPLNGSANILYIATDTLVPYIWDGNSYEPIGGGGGGSGDVTGPASSTDQNITVFDGVTGKIIEDGLIAKDTLALICNDQHAVTNYTFDGTERRNGGYLCNTTSANTTININADLFVTGTEFIFCKGVNDAYTITLDAGSGNNINGTQTIVLTYYNEFVQLIKDGANTWKAIQVLPKNSVVTPTNTVALTNKDLSSGNTFPTFNQNTTGEAGTVATIAGKISAGTNVTITGSGTTASPYVVNSSGGGGGSNPIFTTNIQGQIYTGVIDRFVAKGTQTIAGVKISLGSLPTGSNVSVDIRKNGTATTNSIFTSDNPISITTGQSATNGIYITTGTTIDNGSLVENDVLYVVVTLVGSTLPGSDLEVIIY